MRKSPNCKSALLDPRVSVGFALFCVGTWLTVLASSLVAPKTSAQSVNGDASFTTVGQMNSTRANNTAALLGNGKVLLAGGFTGFASGGITNAADLFDPISGAFTPTSPMIWPRDSATATVLPSGKVLIAGGQMNGPPGDEFNYVGLNTAEIFDPASGTFTALAPMTSKRIEHTATLLPNGKVLIAGGITKYGSGGEIINTAELFDPTSGNFTVTSPMNVARHIHTATLLRNGKVLIAGGHGGWNTAELFDPASGTFTSISPMNFARYHHTATVLPSGKVLLAGGFDANSLDNNGQFSDTAELFDPASGTFTVVANSQGIPNRMTLPRFAHTATLLPSGKVLIAGGQAVWLFGPSEVTDTAELFDPDSENFTSLLPVTMTSRRESQTATLLASGKVLLAGGDDWGIDGGSTKGATIWNTAELFASPAESATFSDARRPVISTAPDTLVQPVPLVLAGAGFRGDSEASGGCFGSSATNHPLLQLTRIDNEQSFFVLSDPTTNWSDTSFTSEPLSNLPPGQYRITAFTNAIPSLPKIIDVTQGPEGILRGTVTESSTGNPLSGVRVTASSYTAVTNESGSYQFSPLAPGTYTETASKVGYFSSSASGVTVTNGAITTQNFALGRNLAEPTPVPTPFPTALQTVNPPVLNDPGDTITTNNYSLSWSPAEVTTELVGYVIEESTDYVNPLFDNADGAPQPGDAASLWTAGQPSNPWIQSPAYYNSAPNSYAVNGEDSGYILPNESSLTLKNNISIPSTVGSGRLTFYSRYFNAPDDTGNVEVSTDDGLNWSSLRILYDLSPPPADTRVQSHEIDMTPYRGTPIKLRFRFNTGNTLYFLNPTLGWWVDDINVDGATWTQIGTTGPNTTSLNITNHPNGQYFYRVRGIYNNTSFTANSNVQDIIVNTPLTLTGVVSRMTHGGIIPPFDINLPLIGARGIECRTSASLGAGSYKLVFTFARSLTSVASASVTTGTGNVSSSGIGPNPNQYTVNLTGVTNAQYVTVNLANVLDSQNNSGNVAATMGVLVGDVNATGRTDSGDVTAVRNHTVSIPDTQTFRFDVNASGRIDSGDVTVTRNASVTVLP
jgi:hypothetical protein